MLGLFAFMITAGAADLKPESAPPFTLSPIAVTGDAISVAGGDRRVLRAQLLRHARGLGWPVQGAELQGPDRSPEARFVLAGEARRAQLAGEERIRLVMWWQLTDRRYDQVLWESQTTTLGGAFGRGPLDLPKPRRCLGVAGLGGRARGGSGGKRRIRNPVPLRFGVAHPPQPCLTRW